MSGNFFSNNDPNLPQINLKDSPKIQKRLPKLQGINSIQLKGDDVLFDIDGRSLTMNDIANEMNSFFDMA